MKLNDSPLFFRIINLQISSAFRIEVAIEIVRDFFERVNFSERTERNGLPNGAIQAAYVKFPTSFSKNLKRTTEEFKTNSIRAKYFVCFFFDSLQYFKIES